MVSSRPGTYLLYGKAEFLKKEFIRDLRRKFFPNEAQPGLNFQEFRVRTHALMEIFDFAQTAPFLSEKRLAVLWNLEESTDEERQFLLSFLDRLAATAVLVLSSEETSLKKSRFLSELAGKCRPVPCHPPFEKELPAWIKNASKRLGKEMTRGAALLLIDRIGKELAALYAAVEQLRLLVEPRPRIEAKDVEELFGSSLEADVFLLADKILEKNARGALEMIAALVTSGRTPFEILAVLAGQLDRIRRGARLLSRGKTAAEIAQGLKIHPFFLDKVMLQTRQLSEETSAFLFKRLLDCDESIKTGALNEDLALERMVLEVCC